MKMDIIFKTVLLEGFWEEIFKSSFVHTKFKIDNRFTGHNGHYISEKCHCGNESCQVFPARSW